MPEKYVIRNTAPRGISPALKSGVAVVRLTENGEGQDCAWCFDGETAKTICEHLNAIDYERTNPSRD